MPERASFQCPTGQSGGFGEAAVTLDSTAGSVVDSTVDSTVGSTVGFTVDSAIDSTVDSIVPRCPIEPVPYSAEWGLWESSGELCEAMAEPSALY